MASTTVILIARWIARLCSLLSLFLLLLFVGAHLLRPEGPRPTPGEWLGLMFFPVGVAAGLMLAWRYEKAGGLVALLALSAFYLWNLLSTGFWPRGPFFLLFAAPALLFLGLSLFPDHNPASRSPAGP